MTENGACKHKNVIKCKDLCLSLSSFPIVLIFIFESYLICHNL